MLHDVITQMVNSINVKWKMGLWGISTLKNYPSGSAVHEVLLCLCTVVVLGSKGRSSFVVLEAPYEMSTKLLDHQ